MKEPRCHTQLIFGVLSVFWVRSLVLAFGHHLVVILDVIVSERHTFVQQNERIQTLSRSRSDGGPVRALSIKLTLKIAFYVHLEVSC